MATMVTIDTTVTKAIMGTMGNPNPWKIVLRPNPDCPAAERPAEAKIVERDYDSISWNVTPTEQGRPWKVERS
jgi:hypothetical protein